MNFPSISTRLRAALREDGAFNDVTTRLLGSRARKSVRAEIVAKQQGVFCGSFLLKPLFQQLGSPVRTKILVKDGQAVRPAMRVATIIGPAQTVLAGERVFLNLAGHLSGVATLTRQFVQAVRGTNAKIVDTRKTMPLWRDLEKFAVKCGGGTNHRFSLADAILWKDNHWQLLNGQLKPPKKRGKLKFIEIEAASLPQVHAALMAQADIVLLDNMPVKLLKESIQLIRTAKRRPSIEVSGGVGLKNVRQIAQLGVDRISVGAITHSAPSLDISLEVL